MWIYILCACLIPVEAKSSGGGESHRTGVTVVVSCLVVLEIKPGSFERPESALHCSAIHFSNPVSVVLYFLFSKIEFQFGLKLKLEVLILLPLILKCSGERLGHHDCFKRYFSESYIILLIIFIANLPTKFSCPLPFLFLVNHSLLSEWYRVTPYLPASAWPKYGQPHLVYLGFYIEPMVCT